LEPSVYVRVIENDKGGEEEYLPQSFFALTPLELTWSADDAAWQVSVKWLDAHVRRMLNLYLGTEAADGDSLAREDPRSAAEAENRAEVLATDVMYEAVLNAASHAQAGVGFTSSQVRRHTSGKLKGQPKELEIVIWDDGKPIVRTLSETLTAGDTIKGRSYPEKGVSINLVIEEDGGLRTVRTIKSDSPDVDATHYGLMVSAFLLGVTSDPSGKRLSTSARPTSPRSSSALGPGGGLYNVRNAVIDEFGGTISYVSGRDRLSLSGTESSGRYEARVERKPPEHPDFPGNLLILSIPLRPPSDAPK
jgi:hypothetical protein